MKRAIPPSILERLEIAMQKPIIMFWFLIFAIVIIDFSLGESSS